MTLDRSRVEERAMVTDRTRLSDPLGLLCGLDDLRRQLRERLSWLSDALPHEVRMVEVQIIRGINVSMPRAHAVLNWKAALPSGEVARELVGHVDADSMVDVLLAMQHTFNAATTARAMSYHVSTREAR